ncbi:MAG: hypothetical protein GF355_10235 [Candidatus Eisenbacteria bacterium]|nr:hypothetical protein [Candidatus Eisenbacteria bacterium]
MTRCIWIVCTVLAAGFLAAPALAEAPALMNYQGVLTDGEGFPINGAYNLTFKIYGDSLGNNYIWEEDHNQVVVNHGLFNVVLGFTTPLPDNLFTSPNRFLGVTVEGDSEMAPRTRLTSVPWAMRAAIADSVTSGGDADNDWIISGINMYAAVSGNVGVGTSAPLAKLHVETGDIALTGDAFHQEEVVIEAGDALLGLYSNDSGSYGSGISLGGISSGELTDKWTMVRTADSSSDIHFIYGSDPNYTLNSIPMSLSSAGLAIGTTDHEAYRLTVDMPDFLMPFYRGGIIIKGGSQNLGDYLEVQSAAGDPVFDVGLSGVGIGTDSPQGDMEVLADEPNVWITGIDGAATLHLKGAGDERGRIQFRDENNDISGEIDCYRFQFGPTITNGMAFRTVGSTRMFIANNGNVGVGTVEPDELFDVDGTMECNVLKIAGGADIAEPFNLSDTDDVEPGTVVTIDAARPGELQVCTKAYDRCVAGIISGAGDVDPGLIMAETGSAADGEYPVALTGRVYCKATAANGAIQPGDLLTTSNVAGHAMKATDQGKAQGAILGKAMTSLTSGDGLVLVLVTLQ